MDEFVTISIVLTSLRHIDVFGVKNERTQAKEWRWKAMSPFNASSSRRVRIPVFVLLVVLMASSYPRIVEAQCVEDRIQVTIDPRVRFFGRSVAVQGNTLLAGALRDCVGTSNCTGCA